VLSSGIELSDHQYIQSKQVLIEGFCDFFLWQSHKPKIDYFFETGAVKWNRTTDLFITNEVLYP